MYEVERKTDDHWITMTTRDTLEEAISAATEEMAIIRGAKYRISYDAVSIPLTNRWLDP